MKVTKLCAFLTAAALLSATVLSGCGNTPGTTSSANTGNTAGESTPVAGDTALTAPQEGGEVVVWNQIFEEWNQNFFTQRAEEYNTKGRGYTVNQEFIPGDAWTERMTTAQASGTAPDTYVLSYNNIVGSAQKQLIQPLDELISKEALDDIVPSAKEMVTYDGKIWAYPQLLEPSTVLYYRTDLFEAAGLTAPPKTWDETIEYAKKLQTNEVFGLGLPGYAEMGYPTWGWQYAASGHLALTDDWSKPNIDQGYRDLADFYKRCYDEGVTPEQPLSGCNDIKGFAEGGLAMSFCGSWGISEILNTYPDMADKFAVAVAPTKDGNQDKPTATSGGWTYVIDAQAKNVKGSADYISWLLGEEPETCGEFFVLAKFAKSAPRTSVQEWVNKQAADSAWAPIVNEIAGNAIPEPVYPWDISVAVALMFENVGTGAMSMDDAVTQCNQTIQDIIDNQSLAGTNPRA